MCFCQVGVIYRETRAGKIAWQCACDVARLFGSDRLAVYVESNDYAESRLSAECGNAQALQHARINQKVKEACRPLAVRTEFYHEPGLPDFPPGMIRIDHELGNQRLSVHCLCPVYESSLEGRHQGPILIPFSDENTGLVASQVGFELAEQWRRARCLPVETPEVVFYHTTWKDPEGISDDAVDQMCESATRVMLALEREAKRRGLRHRFVVETHDDVVQGVIEMAQKTGAMLVVMARGAKIRQGSYVDGTMQNCPIPLLVVGSTTPLVVQPAGDAELEAHRQQRLAAANAQPPVVDRRVIARISQLPVLRSPLCAQSVAAAMDVIKAISKIGVGLWVASPMITGDGFHNIADIVQAIAVAVVIVVAQRPSNERYPYGRKNIEWFASLVIGIMLFGAAGKLTMDCLSGLLSCWPAGDAAVRSVANWLPAPEQSHLDARTFPWVLTVTVTSLLLSLLVSRYQIIVGKRTGHASLVAGGQETVSDGWIELVTIIGVTVEFSTGWRLIEYPLGLFVAFLILRTAGDLFVGGWRVLLQHSIGEENEQCLRDAVMQVAAVESVRQLKSFQVGHTAVIMITVESLAGRQDEGDGINYVRQAVEKAIRDWILRPDGEYKGVDVHVIMQRPDPCHYRIGYALVVDGDNAWVAPSLAAATHLAVSDVKHGDIWRTKLVPITLDPVALLLLKRVQKLYTLQPAPGEQEALSQQARARLRTFRAKDVVPIPQLVQATCYTLRPLGLRV